MKEELYDDLFDEREEKTDYSALLFPYIIRWPWIVASVVVCVALAWVYLRFATPVYNISATVLIKDDKKGGSISSDLALFQDMGMLSTSGISSDMPYTVADELNTMRLTPCLRITSHRVRVLSRLLR